MRVMFESPALLERPFETHPMTSKQKKIRPNGRTNRGHHERKTRVSPGQQAKPFECSKLCPARNVTAELECPKHALTRQQKKSCHAYYPKRPHQATT